MNFSPGSTRSADHLQAALLRSPDDLSELLRRSGRICLVKGAYAEPSERALARSSTLDATYRTLAERLLDAARRGRACSIATHDPVLLEGITDAVRDTGGPSAYAKTALQFEMLQGVAPQRLDALASSGFTTRV